MEIAFVVSGFAVGLLVGVSGVGGGSVMTPLLVVVYQVPVLIAVGTDLLFAAITKSIGAWGHARLDTVSWRVVALMAAGSLPATLISLAIVERLMRHYAGFEHLAGVMLGGALLVTAAALLFGARRPPGEDRPWNGVIGASRAWLTVMWGALLGLVVSVTSIGAGALGIVVLRWLYRPMRMAQVVGTDIAHAVPLAAIAGLGHWHLGTVDFGLLAALLVGSLPGILLGARVSVAVPERIMRPVMAGVLAVAGISSMA